MARPIKTGVDFFPLDVHMDDSIELIEAEFGLEGFAIVVKLWQKIYAERGYYCEWNDEVALLFAKKIGAGGNVVSEIVNAAIRRGIFNDELFNRYGILTSFGIQTRYFEITSRRTKVDVDERYLLVSAPENGVSVTKTGVSVYRNRGLCIQKSHKVKESKVNKSKVNKSKVNESSDAAAEIFERYEKTTGLTITSTMMSDVDSFITNGTEPELICTVIDYAADSGKGNWNYIRGALNNLTAEGVKTKAEYEKRRAARSKNKAAGPQTRRSKFYNYIDTDPVDYAAIEEKIFEMQMKGE